ncbi:hydrocephalus-inducing protein-like [Opisthocomus hoazin]|uniref:hydrocephalus-inducing protein-like n=1 Tax=Opisthocomus hoazin TaxID=30419 RepID=UPI003F529E73
MGPEPEPAHTVLEKSSREVELCLSAVVEYADFKLDTDMIQFKETSLFQTRKATVPTSRRRRASPRPPPVRGARR